MNKPVKPTKLPRQRPGVGWTPAELRNGYQPTKSEQKPVQPPPKKP